MIYSSAQSNMVTTHSQDSSPSKPPRTIQWYRSPLDKSAMKELIQRSDRLGLWQAGGHLSLIALTAGLTAYAQLKGLWLWVGIGAFCYGTVTWFSTNAVHELAHGTVFKTKPLNSLFAAVFAFIGMLNHTLFWISHREHHKFTLHQPDDLEVVEPETHHSLKGYLLHAVFHPDLRITGNLLLQHFRLARGQLKGEWETHLLADNPIDQARVAKCSRNILLGHAAVWIICIWTGIWIIPVLLTFYRQFGGWLFIACNSTQHIGLQDEIADFRICCRSIRLHPFVRFLYWHMNYHIEHHMYASVPCYRLKKLHRLIEHDLPPTPKGLIDAWRQIIPILRRQKKDSRYRYVPPLPES